MNTVDVNASRYGRYYALYINHHHVGLVSDLGKAKRHIRDHLDRLEPYIDHSDWGVRVSMGGAFEDLYDYPSGG